MIVTTARWRNIQLQAENSGFVIPQEQQLYKFITKNNIKTIQLIGDIDPIYAKNISDSFKCCGQDSVDLLIVFANHFEMKLENILKQVENQIQHCQPIWIYIAINKYLVTTNELWDNLTDNYDLDLLNIVSKFFSDRHYTELARNNILDLGSSYNFVHPTTNLYFRIND
jgi:hypothetical protein